MLKIGDHVRVRPYDEVADHREIRKDTWAGFGDLVIEQKLTSGAMIVKDHADFSWYMYRDMFEIDIGDFVDFVPTSYRNTDSISEDTWNTLGICKVVGKHTNPKTGINWLHVFTSSGNDWFVHKEDAILYEKAKIKEEKKMNHVGETFTRNNMLWTIKDVLRYPWMKKEQYLCQKENGMVRVFDVDYINPMIEEQQKFTYSAGDRVILKPYNSANVFLISNEMWNANRVVTVSESKMVDGEECCIVKVPGGFVKEVTLHIPVKDIAGKIEDVSLYDILSMETDKKKRDDLEWAFSHFTNMHGYMEGQDSIDYTDDDTVMNRAKEYILGQYKSPREYLELNGLCADYED